MDFPVFEATSKSVGSELRYFFHEATNLEALLTDPKRIPDYTGLPGAITRAYEVSISWRLLSSCT